MILPLYRRLELPLPRIQPAFLDRPTRSAVPIPVAVSRMERICGEEARFGASVVTQMYLWEENGNLG